MTLNDPQRSFQLLKALQ